MKHTGILAAWIVGEGIIVYRSVKNKKRPPLPGELAYSSGLFLMLAILAESDRFAALATTVAWGLDIAAWMNLWGSGVVGSALSGPAASTPTSAPSSTPSATTPIPGGPGRAQ